MSDRIHKARVIWGRPGFSNGFVTAPQLTAAITGLAPSTASYITRTAEAGLSNEFALSSIGPGLLKVGDHNGVIGIAGGSDVPAHNHTGVVVSVSFDIDGGGSAIAAGNKYIGIYVPVPLTITGWVLDASTSSNLALTVSRALAASPTTYSAISGTEKPTLASQQTNSDLALTTWTTSLAAGDRLKIDADATPTAVKATLTLLFTRSI